MEIHENGWSDHELRSDGKILYLIGGEMSGNIRAIVVTSDLKEITASGSSVIHMDNFRSDTLAINLNGTSKIIGKENEIAHILIKTSGESRIEWTDDLDKKTKNQP